MINRIMDSIIRYQSTHQGRQPTIMIIHPKMIGRTVGTTGRAYNTFRFDGRDHNEIYFGDIRVLRSKDLPEYEIVLG